MKNLKLLSIIMVLSFVICALPVGIFAEYAAADENQEANNKSVETLRTGKKGQNKQANASCVFHLRILLTVVVAQKATNVFRIVRGRSRSFRNRFRPRW